MIDLVRILTTFGINSLVLNLFTGDWVRWAVKTKVMTKEEYREALDAIGDIA